MGERRNRKSIWDTEHESKHMSGMREHDFWPGKDHHSGHDSGRYRDLADSRTSSMRDSRDNSGWSSWDSIEDPIAPMSRSFKNTYGGKDMGVEKRYHKNISPEFDEMELRDTYGGKDMGREKRYHKNISPEFDDMELRDYNHTNEYDRSHSQRYVRKGRSRSRSRSRTHGRSRSRSLSRGREKERERGRGWSRSRSRSRSDGYGYGNAHRRSRSPIGDYRRHPYGWGDKGSGQEKSSQTCRDFVSGRCRNGSLCRFFHPDSRSRRDDLEEDDKVESWRGRSDHSQISKHSYTRLGFESRKDASDLYRGENEQFLNTIRAKIPCRDFRMGNCRWGDTCRFSHDEASAESFDHQQFINEKPLCIFFAAGRCTRDNCWFSHDDPNLKNLDGRLDKVTERKGSNENSNWRNAPKWDDATRADAPIPTGWGEAIATNTTSTGDITNGKSECGWGFKSNDDSKIWGIQEWTTSSLDSEKQPSHPMENGSFGGDMHPAKSFTEDNVTQKQDHLILHSSQLQNKDVIANHGLNALPENQNLASEALQQNVPPSSHIQLQHFGVTSNPMSSFGSSVRDEIKDTRYMNNPVLLSGQSFNRNDTSTFPRLSLVSTESDREQNMLYTNLSNGLAIDLNRPETHMINPLNVQIHGHNDKSTVQSPGSLEARVPQILMHLLTSKHPDQVSNSLVTNDGRQVSPVKVTVSPTPSFVNEHPQTSGVIDVSNSKGMMLSLSCITGYPPLVSTSTVQDNKHAVSLDQLGSSIENIERGNLNLAQATDSQNNQMQPNRSPPPSIVVTGVESSKLKHPEIPRQQGETVANLGVPGDSKAMGEESKNMQDNRPSENLDDQGKLDERSANKDEKGMRLFKNCLVELVKEILKPTWKEGRMTRDVHKTVVKKVVDKVSSTIQAEHIPKTQDKVDLYLSSSKPKITKLVQAYVDRSRKPDA